MKWLAFLIGLTASPSLAAEPFARATIDVDDQIVPGQQVHVIVDVFAPDFFTSPPQFPLFDMPDALVTLPDDRAQNMVQTVDGRQYSGIRRIYAVVPEKQGSFTVPRVHIPLGWSVEGKPATGEVVTTEVRFEVAGSTDTVFTARKLEISQSFDRDPSGLKAGDALVRTIVVTAREAQGITMPAIDVGTATGLRQYVKPPKIEDGVQFGRGDTGARRTETIVYTTNKEGSFTIPSVSYPWFDIDARQEGTASLTAINAAVAAKAASPGIAIEERQSSFGPASTRRKIMLGIAIALGVAAASWFGRRLPSEAIYLWHRVKEQRLNSRRYRLGRLRLTILRAAPSEVYAALDAWARHEGHRTVREWLTDLPPGPAAEVNALERGLFAGGEVRFDRRKLASMLDTTPVITATPTSALPPLNPVRAGDVTSM